MNAPLRMRRSQALSVIELFIVVAVLLILLSIFLPLMSRPHVHSHLTCINNQNQIGLAFKTWALDNNNLYPMQVSVTNGGTMELVAGPNAFIHFQVMSNELSTPLILVCPQDTNRRRAISFGPTLSSTNVSYFVNIDAVDTNSTMLLSGDRNLKSAAPRVNGLLTLSTNIPIEWTRELHDRKGNLLLTDGSVQPVDDRGLRNIVWGSNATNRLAMP